MQLFTTPTPLQAYLFEQRKQNKKIGLVPTMGALHEGHLQLVTSCVKEADITVCSIYINPTQFNNPDDLKNYPRDFEGDVEKLKLMGCQAVFYPDNETMYPEESKVTFHFGEIESVMEGKYRPGHFSGVALVVSKLFHIVQPDLAFFGMKDLQQLVIIRQLVQDLYFPLEIVAVPIVRESDGLAMSSRNQLLDKHQRTLAAKLHQTLRMVEQGLLSGALVKEAIQSGIDLLTPFPSIRLEYLKVVHPGSLQEVPADQPASAPMFICIAAFLGEVRLIDNLEVLHD
jgi:pantoate--beta-alanine ligase